MKKISLGRAGFGVTATGGGAIFGYSIYIRYDP